MEISETIARTTLTYAKDLKVKATEKRHINKKRKPAAANGKQKKTVTPFFPFIHKVSVAVQFPVGLMPELLLLLTSKLITLTK